MVNELPDLIGLHRNEPLVAAVLPILLLEHYAGNSASFSLLGGDVLAGDSSRDCIDSLRVLRVGSWEPVEICQRRGLRGRRLRRDGDRGGRLGEVTETVV